VLYRITEPANDIRLFVKLNCQISSIILSVKIKYSMRDLIRDVIYCTLPETLRYGSFKVCSPNFNWLVTFRHDTTLHLRRVEPMHFGWVELVE